MRPELMIPKERLFGMTKVSLFRPKGLEIAAVLCAEIGWLKAALFNLSAPNCCPRCGGAFSATNPSNVYHLNLAAFLPVLKNWVSCAKIHDTKGTSLRAQTTLPVEIDTS